MIVHVLPLLAFTTFAGLAAGAYAVDSVCGNGREVKVSWLFPLVCMILLCIGLCGTLAHLGQPLRFMNGMANPASGISQESYWAIALGMVIVVELVISWRGGKSVRAVRWLGGVVAMGFMVVTGLAYFDCLGLVAWRGAATLPLFILGDVALGVGLCAVLTKDSDWATGLLAPATVAVQASWGVVVVAYGLYLVRSGLDATGLLAVAFVLGPVCASSVAAAARCGKLAGGPAAVAVFVLSCASVAIVRYAFFAMGVGA
ncbi:hypothetical protein [Slackia exigua]|uniref:hypothetical protein n=1 Tax=Slackia exigua TaxID=84109 RepID=UPI002004239F|nr:hypothetical protein [Slackia exigua]MCK6139772.1 dimethyl sulfoxide reductase anchor subunit [Slackia exigua]